MSQENVEVVRKQIDDLRRRDWTAWLEAFDPDVEFRLPPEWPDEGAGTGRDAALASKPVDTAVQIVDFISVKISWDAERQNCKDRHAAHRSDVAQIYRQRLVAHFK